jgi:hypothetical protein
MIEKRQNTGKMTLKKCQKRVPPQDQIFTLENRICLWFEHFGDGKVLFMIFSINSVFISTFIFSKLVGQHKFQKTDDKKINFDIKFLKKPLAKIKFRHKLFQKPST